MTHKIFVDGREYSVEKPRLAGGEIKELAQAPGSYQLFRRVSDEEDEPVADHWSLDMSGEPRFYTVPPTTGA